jgi:NAD(P)-dependent dehydrogenase (short-subunit alcohol dehydrogenase family)
MPYSVTKAAQLHLMRCLASTQGPKIRVNAVLPGFLSTEWVRTFVYVLIEESNTHFTRERSTGRTGSTTCERKLISGKTSVI